MFDSWNAKDLLVIRLCGKTSMARFVSTTISMRTKLEEWTDLIQTERDAIRRPWLSSRQESFGQSIAAFGVRYVYTQVYFLTMIGPGNDTKHDSIHVENPYNFTLPLLASSTQITDP